MALSTGNRSSANLPVTVKSVLHHVSLKYKAHSKKDQKNLKAQEIMWVYLENKKMWSNIHGEKKYSSINAGNFPATTMGMEKIGKWWHFLLEQEVIVSFLVENTAGMHRAPFQLDMAFLFLLRLLAGFSITEHLPLFLHPVFYSLSISTVLTCPGSNNTNVSGTLYTDNQIFLKLY